MWIVGTLIFFANFARFFSAHFAVKSFFFLPFLELYCGIQ